MVKLRETLYGVHIALNTSFSNIMMRQKTRAQSCSVEHKEITNRTTMSPTTDIDGQVPTVYNR